MTSSSFQRWYDRDPALANALNSLRSAPSRYHAQVAINIIKIILEHRLEGQQSASVTDETIRQQVETVNQSTVERLDSRRWYDVNETLRAAMHMLEQVPDDMSQEVMPSIVATIENALAVELQ